MNRDEALALLGQSVYAYIDTRLLERDLLARIR